MEISFFNEEIELPLFDQAKTIDIYARIASDHEESIDYINVIFCSDEYLLNVNQEYLQHDYYTDIITFDYSEEELASDMYISVDRVAENASELQLDFSQELYRILIHGMLHLVGYEDKDEDSKIIMTSKEDHYLALI
jgi:probable rRNA maturation factor